MRRYDGLFSEAGVQMARRMIDARQLAERLTVRDPGRAISASGVRHAAWRGDIPNHQLKPGGLMLFDWQEIEESGYKPNRRREKPTDLACSNPRCKRGAGASRARVEVTAYAARNYGTHFCCPECKYEASGAWNPGGGRRGPERTDWRLAFLEALRAGASVAAAASSAGVAKATPYRHRVRDPEFAADWADAMPEVSARRRYWQNESLSGDHRQTLEDLGKRNMRSTGHVVKLHAGTVRRREDREPTDDEERRWRNGATSRAVLNKKRTARDQLDQLIAAELSAGHSRSEVARRLSCSRDRVQDAVARLGLAPGQPGRPRKTVEEPPGDLAA